MQPCRLAGVMVIAALLGACTPSLPSEPAASPASPAPPADPAPAGPAAAPPLPAAAPPLPAADVPPPAGPTPLAGDPAPPAGAAGPVGEDKPEDPGTDTPSDRWCAPELESLEHEVCSFTPKRESLSKRTLVIFLHGVIKPDTSWQWAQQRGIARAAAVHGFSVIMPRGRIGNGPKGMEMWWTWPTGMAAQGKIEDEVIAEWEAARSALESSSKQPFERVWVFGFSNGAYYATSLAMRGRLAGPASLRADGFATFAGGSGAEYLSRTGRTVKDRAPFFVAWGEKDKAHKDQVGLARMLRSLGWPSKSESARRAGHVMTDQQAKDAVHFLDTTRVSKSAGPRPGKPARASRAAR